MSSSSFVHTKRFLPLFVTQFLGAFNDNLFRTALITMLTFQAVYTGDGANELLIPAALGIFILPFFLFSATAGQIGDMVNKAQLIRFLKLAEIIVMGLAAIGFMMATPYFLLGVLFLMGLQSALFGPVKYSIIPDHLKRTELLMGNGLIEAATFIAILLGTILGGILISNPDSGLTVITPFTIGIAVIGYVASAFIPKTKVANPQLKIKANIFKTTYQVIREVKSQRRVFLSILGISWFWFVGSVFLSQIPVLTRDVLGGTEGVFTTLLTVFSFGIGVGSVLCHALLKGEVSSRYVPISVFLMTFFIWDFAATAMGFSGPMGSLSATAFVHSTNGIRLLVDLFIVSFLGGVFTVPLYSLLQTLSDDNQRSQVIAANNIMNALFMVVASGLVVVLLAQDITIPQIFMIMAVMNLGVAAYIMKLLPDMAAKHVLGALFKLLFRVEVKGLENYKKCGKKAIIIANHTSYLDAALLAVFLPEKVTFAINTHVAESRLVKPFLKLVKAFPIDPTNPMSTKSLIEVVNQNEKVIIFPEGRLTTTGGLMKIYPGPSMIADKTDADILSVRIDGAQLSVFSRLKSKFRLKLFPKITMEILPPQKLDVAPEITGRARRIVTGQRLYQIMSDSAFRTSNLNQTLFGALLEARKTHGGKHKILQDVSMEKLTYDQLVTRVFVLGNVLKRKTEDGEHVGIMLPNVNGCVITFFALQAIGRVPAMMNFATGVKNMILACETAQIKTILTSRRFILDGKLEAQVEALEEAGVNVAYLEDMRKQVSVTDKLGGYVLQVLTSSNNQGDPEDSAVILFTSGSEGTPKAVVLSHKNLQANRFQVGSAIDFNPADTVFNTLPIFHSFGLTGGTLLPILSGVKVFLYPSPLHYRVVPELIYDTGATIMFGTDTFLSAYARYAHPYDFHTLRYVFAGAEKLKEETRRIWSDKYGVRILEGYGATETSPVIAMNTPMYSKLGTVGCMVPGLEYRLEPVPGIEEGGQLFVKGPNIMKGYLLHDKPGKLVPPAKGWYDTGDIVEIDDEGYVSICGRVKRFAKIGGEMISLSAVESYLTELWPENAHAVVAIKDAKKGEQLLLFTSKEGADKTEISKFVKAKGLPDLGVPKQIRHIEKLPLLGTGKVDYTALQEMAEAED